MSPFEVNGEEILQLLRPLIRKQAKMVKMTNISRAVSKALSVAEAKAHFSECIETALEEGYILITRYGKPVAAVVDIQDLAQLQRLRAAREAGSLADIAEGWEDADEFAQILDEIVQDRDRSIPE